VSELRNKLEVIEKRAAERKALEDKKRKEEVPKYCCNGHVVDDQLAKFNRSLAWLVVRRWIS
jgi:hypothetical protein